MSIISCPNCEIPIYVESINCMIFRCGVFCDTGQPIPPHASQVECEFYVNNKLIYGCGSPFKYDGTNAPIICDYI
jgi:hypothetical protein